MYCVFSSARIILRWFFFFSNNTLNGVCFFSKNFFLLKMKNIFLYYKHRSKRTDCYCYSLFQMELKSWNLPWVNLVWKKRTSGRKKKKSVNIPSIGMRSTNLGCYRERQHHRSEQANKFRYWSLIVTGVLILITKINNFKLNYIKCVNTSKCEFWLLKRVLWIYCSLFCESTISSVARYSFTMRKIPRSIPRSGIQLNYKIDFILLAHQRGFILRDGLPTTLATSIWCRFCFNKKYSETVILKWKKNLVYVIWRMTLYDMILNRNYILIFMNIGS